MKSTLQHLARIKDTLGNVTKMPMQYTENFFQEQKLKNSLFIFAQNINCGAVLTSTHNLCFGAKISRGDKVPDLSGIPDLGICSCLVSGLGL